MEVSALTHGSTAPGLRGPSPLLGFQSDERLVALTRRGQPAAFEVLCARYQARLLSFVRHMLGSREDAEDVLQEVFAAAFNAVLADEREINVRPWLYRIARNRALNHLRRATAVGVDSMDIHFADHGLSTGDRVLRRESFRELLFDVQQLPETQRSALLLREIDALSYEQIAHAMETTVPSVKSLLVRARISLAEAAEARKLSCGEVRLELGEAAEGLVAVSAPARRHVRDCDRCRAFKRQLKDNNRALAMMLPVGPLLLVKQLLLAKLSSTASASSAHVASGATVGAGAAASAGAAGGASAGGVFTLGAGALASKAVAGLAAAAIVSAGAVAANQTATHPRHHHAPAARLAYVPAHDSELPLVASQQAQPLSATISRPVKAAPSGAHRRHLVALKHTTASAKAPLTAAAVSPVSTAAAGAAPAASAKATPPATPAPPLTQLTSESTQLPASATAPPQTATASPAGEAAPAPQAASTTATTPTTTPAAAPQGPSAAVGSSGTQPAAALTAPTHPAAKALPHRRHGASKAHARRGAPTSGRHAPAAGGAHRRLGKRARHATR